ncbi:DUF2785 domain-containing protein [Luteipulveratus halotolerans]|uniref:DUF2785 domain-containing protein n=1 Tax=Luteipulveratus halotolerans TaxID=1631356 RepID=A0A0L6CHL8_9MICO|nr:DUF2785 domain-containing protein [Luteipulveratus halotolerans]KNX37008.1 hypothetical protein VV01_07380 [Luteipulveratus halotolerans]
MDDETLDQLLTDLASPDPVVRDEKAYTQLAQAISDRELTQDQLKRVATTMRERLRHDEIQARTFGALVLAALVEAGEWDDAWFVEVRDWYLAETDLRGYDETLGWLHAVAHGADFFGESAAADRVPGADVLQVLVTRCVTPTEYVWREQEEVRLAAAFAMALTDRRLDKDSAVAWSAEVAAALEIDVPSPPPFWSNTVRTLQTLYVGLDHQVLHSGEPVDIKHVGAIQEAVAATIQPTQPWFWRASRTGT